MEGWEYASIVVPSTRSADMTRTLNNAGVKGWELVGLTDNDPTLGANSLVAIVKRKIVPFDPPRDIAADWKPDPSERHQGRYWDGECWTFRVADDGVESRDSPTRLAPALRPQ